MVALLSFPGREFPGLSGLYDIENSEYKSVRARAERGESLSLISKVWDAIFDWFCKTRIGEAKSCLHALYTQNTSDAEKLRNFNRLRDLAAGPYKMRFREWATPDGFVTGISATTSAFLYAHQFSDPKQICSHDFMEREINAEITAARRDDVLMQRNLDAFARDLGRADYYIDDERYVRDGDASREPSQQASDFLMALAERLQCTVAQLDGINVLAYQKIFGILMQSSLEENGGLLRPADTLRMSGIAQKLEYGFGKQGDALVMTARFEGSFGTMHESLATADTPSRAALMRDAAQEIVLRIEPDGVARVVSAAYGMAAG